MRRNFKPGLRRDRERLDLETPAADTPADPVEELCEDVEETPATKLDEAGIMARFNEAIASDTVVPFKVLEPPAVSDYPIQLPPSSE